MSLTDGLLALYRLEQAAYTGAANEVLDSSGNGNHGTSSATGVASLSSAVIGKGASFDGATGKISLPVSVLQTSGTIAMWLKVNWSAIVDGASTRIFGANGTNADMRFRTTISTLTGNISVFVAGSPTELVIPGLPDNVWAHFVLTWDNLGEYMGYINGVLEATNTGTAITPPDTYFDLARWDANFLDCDQDEVTVYSRPIVQAEITQLYNEGRGIVIPTASEIAAHDGRRGSELLKTGARGVIS